MKPLIEKLGAKAIMFKWKQRGGGVLRNDGVFTPTEKDRRLYALAKQYHEETEAYDQRVCSCRNMRGTAMPKDHYEAGLISRNAMTVRNRLLANNRDINKEELHKVINRYAPD